MTFEATTLPGTMTLQAVVGQARPAPTAVVVKHLLHGLALPPAILSLTWPSRCSWLWVSNRPVRCRLPVSPAAG